MRPHSNDHIIIVSGAPRSGTSMMMRLLEAAGVPVLIDHVRQPDEDNPNGYYEFEPVKRVREDPSWILQAQGCAVKMVYRLLYDMPPEFDYRVVLMERNLKEIVRSQNAMLRRHGYCLVETDEDKIVMLLAEEMLDLKRWAAQQKNFRLLCVAYESVIDRPEVVLPGVANFLERNIDVAHVSNCVDHRLYRQRA